ncbi:16972_t:CDS:10, partial [Gigaspora margarita]
FQTSFLSICQNDMKETNKLKVINKAPTQPKKVELITLQGITTSQINQALKATNPYPARVFLKVDNQDQDIPGYFSTLTNSPRKSFTAYSYSLLNQELEAKEDKEREKVYTGRYAGTYFYRLNVIIENKEVKVIFAFKDKIETETTNNIKETNLSLQLEGKTCPQCQQKFTEKDLERGNYEEGINKRTMEKTSIVFLTILIMENLLLAVGLAIYLYRTCQKCQKVKEIDRQQGEALELLTTITDKSVSLIFLDPQYEKVGDVSRNPTNSRKFTNRSFPNIWQEGSVSDKQRKHPHQKPFFLLRSLIEATTQEGDLIVDPCAGSFIVLKACQETNRNFLGAEFVVIVNKKSKKKESQKISQSKNNMNTNLNTVNIYTQALQQFFQVNPTINTETIRSFLKRYLTKYQPNTLKIFRQALKRINGIIPKMGRKFFNILNPQELAQLKQARAERNQKTYRRNNLIFDFLFYGGLRVSELVNIRHIKYFNPNSNDYLFTNQKKQPLSPLVIRQIIQQRLKKAGIDKPITPHSFRRSFATHLHNLKAQLTTIQMLLGHESITTTEKYIHNDFDYIYADYKKRNIKQLLVQYKTYALRTGKRLGGHIYLLLKELPPNGLLFNKIKQKIGEIQSQGKYVIGLGSIHQAGIRYN